MGLDLLSILTVHYSVTVEPGAALGECSHAEIIITASSPVIQTGGYPRALSLNHLWLLFPKAAFCVPLTVDP